MSLALVLSALLSSSTTAAIVSFNDIPRGNDVPNPYNGLMWTNFYSIVTGQFVWPNGYVYACVDGTTFVRNEQGGAPASIASGLFNLNGGRFASGWMDNLQLRVEGFLNGTLLYSNTWVLSATSPTILAFDYQGVDTVVFTPFGGTPHEGYLGDLPTTSFGLDNLDVTIIHDALISSEPESRTALAGDSVQSR